MFRIGNNKIRQNIIYVASNKIINISKREYHNRIIDHYESPRNVGSFSKDSRNIGTGLVGAPACGDVMKLQIKVDNGKIIDAKFKTFGCGSAIASSSYVTELIKGKNIEYNFDSIKNDQFLSLLDPTSDEHASMEYRSYIGPQIIRNVMINSIQNYKDNKND